MVFLLHYKDFKMLSAPINKISWSNEVIILYQPILYYKDLWTELQSKDG